MPAVVTCKRCSRCREELPLDAFHRGNGPGGTQGYCKRCNLLYKADRYSLTKDRHNALRNARNIEQTRQRRRERIEAARVAGRGVADALDPAFGNWLAGFIDGEGSFSIGQNVAHGGYYCMFLLTLRDDDRGILEEAATRLGIGRVVRATSYGRSNPKVVWQVWGQHSVMVLVEVLRRYPLRAKKARDFALWAQAVETWMRRGKGEPWDEMAALRAALIEGRRYA